MNRLQASSIPFALSTDESPRLKSSYKWRRVLLKVSGEALAGDQEKNNVRNLFLGPLYLWIVFTPSSSSFSSIQFIENSAVNAPFIKTFLSLV